MKHLMNLINVAIEIIIHLYLQHRLHQITLIEVHLRAYRHLLMYIRAMVPGMVVLPTLTLRLTIMCNHQITLTLTEVHLPVYHLLLIHIRVMAPGMVVLIIIIINIMDTILVLETIVGSLVEAIIITIKADHPHHRCLLIFLHVLLHLWVRVKTIAIVIATEIDITEEMGGTITEDQTLLVVVATGGGEMR